jgi:hypothetical protein
MASNAAQHDQIQLDFIGKIMDKLKEVIVRSC